MDLLTVQETAALLRLNPKTVRNYIASGRLAARRVGRRVRVERTAAEALAVPFGAVAPDAAKRTNGAGKTSGEIATEAPLNREEIAQQLAALSEATAFSAGVRASRRGELLPESWPLIRRSREERSHQR